MIFNFPSWAAEIREEMTQQRAVAVYFDKNQTHALKQEMWKKWGEAVDSKRNAQKFLSTKTDKLLKVREKRKSINRCHSNVICRAF